MRRGSGGEARDLGPGTLPPPEAGPGTGLKQAPHSAKRTVMGLGMAGVAPPLTGGRGGFPHPARGKSPASCVACTFRLTSEIGSVLATSGKVDAAAVQSLDVLNPITTMLVPSRPLCLQPGPPASQTELRGLQPRTPTQSHGAEKEVASRCDGPSMAANWGSPPKFRAAPLE